MNSANVTAARKTTSSPLNTWSTTNSASRSAATTIRRVAPGPPSGRSRSAARAIRITHHTIAGTSHWAVMCGWLLACETMPGPNPQNAAATPAANRLAPSVWRSSRYQAMAVAARLPAVSSANETGAPASVVTGAKSTPITMIVALTIMLKPAGALMRSLTRPTSPTSRRTSLARNHSMRVWSSGLSPRVRVAGSGHRPWVSQNAATT